MKTMRLYALYDRVAMQFQAPFCSVNDGTAVRMFISNCRHPELAYIAGDLDLYFIGELDIATGEFSSDGKPVFIHRVTESEVIKDGD